MLYLLILLLFLSAVWFYFGFFRKETESYLLPRIRGGFMIFLALGIIVAYALNREHHARNEIAQYITPYNGNMQAIFTPGIPGSNSRLWLFESQDIPQQVRAFYGKPENRGQWQLIRDFPFMTLRKNDQELVISATASNKTLITYELRKGGE